MPNITSLPINLRCQCGQSLFEGIVTLCYEGTVASYDLVGGNLNMQCTNCKKHLKTCDDDFTRALDALERDHG